MKGFKQMGRGMSQGFKYPINMGFTGSTGAVTNVTGYTRKKFASGGFVRQDNPREKVERGEDPGHATVQRNKPSSNLDQQAGGRAPLRPGYKRGGRAKMTGKPAGALQALSAPAGKGMPMKGPGRFKATMKKADGGPARSSSKSFLESLGDIPELVKELLRASPKAATPEGAATKAGEKISGRQKSIDDYVDSAVTGKRNYRKGGKARC